MKEEVLARTKLLASGAASGAAKEASVYFVKAAMVYHIRSTTTDAAAAAVNQTLCATSAQTPKSTNLLANLQMHKKALLRSNWPVRKWHVFDHNLQTHTRTFLSPTTSHLALHLLSDDATKD